MQNTYLRPRYRKASLALAACVTGVVTAAYAGPTVFWASDPVMPGEAALIVGHDLEGATASMRCISTHCRGAREHPVSLLQAQASSFKVVVPLSMPRGIYMLDVRTPTGDTSVGLNRPTVYWQQGDLGVKSSTQGWIRVFGRAISLNAGARLHLAGDKKRVSLQAETTSLWEATFRLAGLEEGTYTASLEDESNTLIELGQAVVKDQGFPARSFDVKQHGAKGNGIASDSAALGHAIALAAQQGGRVFFPAGRYRLTAPISVPPNVEIVGESRETVSLFWPDSPTPPRALISGTRDFRIADLTIYATNYRHLITNDVPGEAHGNVQLERLRVHGNPYRGQQRPAEIDARLREQLTLSSGGGDLVRLRGAGLRIADSVLDAGGRSIALLSPVGAHISGNTIYNGRWGWYTISGPSRVIFEGNSLLGGDLMSTGGGINTLNDSSTAENVFFGNNRFERLFGWDREAITSDGGFGIYYGHVSSVAGTKIRLSQAVEGSGSQRTPWRGSGLFILGGKGSGQVARIASVLGPDEFELEQPLAVSPDQTSIVTVVPMQRNFIFHRNTFVDTGVAIQYYGTSLNHVAAENTSTRTAGIFNTGRWYRHYQPSWYCQFFKNEIVEGNFYRGGSNNAVESGEGVIGSYGFQRAPNETPLVLGVVHRGNRVRAAGAHHIEGTATGFPPVKDVIVEVADEQLPKVRIIGGVAGALVRTAP